MATRSAEIAFRNRAIRPPVSIWKQCIQRLACRSISASAEPPVVLRRWLNLIKYRSSRSSACRWMRWRHATWACPDGATPSSLTAPVYFSRWFAITSRAGDAHLMTPCEFLPHSLRGGRVCLQLLQKSGGHVSFPHVQNMTMWGRAYILTRSYPECFTFRYRRKWCRQLDKVDRGVRYKVQKRVTVRQCTKVIIRAFSVLDCFYCRTYFVYCLVELVWVFLRYLILFFCISEFRNDQCAVVLFIAQGFLCYDVSVRLSVTEVHCCIIANLGFKFRSHFTAHWISLFTSTCW